MHITFIGAGRAGGSLGKFFYEAGLKVRGYYSRTVAQTQSAARNSRSSVFNTMEEAVRGCEILILAVPDDEIAKTAARVAQLGIGLNGVVAHLSGAHASGILSAISGAQICSVHPPFPFASPQTPMPRDIMFTLEGQTALLEVLFENNGINYTRIKAEQKPLYHAAAVMCSNNLTALLDVGFAMLEAAGFAPISAREAFGTLIRAAAEGCITHGPANALTGPVSRGDASAVAAHLDAIGQFDNDWSEIYRTMSRHALGMSTLSPGKRAGLEELLYDERSKD